MTLKLERMLAVLILIISVESLNAADYPTPVPGPTAMGARYSTYHGAYYNNKSRRALADQVFVPLNTVVANVDFALTPGSGAIEGRVSVAGTNQPLENVLVQAMGNFGDEWSSFWAATLTGSDGRYRLEGLPAYNAYTVGTFFPEQPSNYITEYYRNKNASTADPVAVTAGQTTYNIDFDLPVGGIIMGNVVRNDDGAALEGEWVYAFNQTTGASGYAVIDAAGNYAIKGLAPSDYVVYIYGLDWELVNLYYNHKLSMLTADLVTVAAGDNPPPSQRNINFRVPIGGMISGHIVHTAPGATCNGLFVSATLQNGSYHTRFAYADCLGHYRLQGLPTGTYTVMVSEIPATVTGVAVVAPNETSQINFETCPATAGRGEIRGRVTIQASGQPLVNLPLHAYPLSGGSEPLATCTDSDGRYRLCNVYPGSYAVRVMAPETRWIAEYHNNCIEYDAATPVTVTDSQITRNIDFQLRYGGVVTGHVTDARTGQSLANWPVTVDYQTTTPLQASTVTTDELGMYSCEYLESGGLPDRNYYVRANHSTTVEVATATPAAPTPTLTPTIGPSPTQYQCEQTGVTVVMPSSYYRAGDSCWVVALVCNAETVPLTGYPLFCILEVYGSYFFGPSFGTEFDNYLAVCPSFEPDTTAITILSQFSWPNGAGSAAGINWHGALTNPEMTDLYGEMSTFTFGWGE